MKYTAMIMMQECKKECKSVLQHYIQEEDCTQIVLLCKEEEIYEALQFSKDGHIVFVLAGDTWEESLYNGLKAAQEEFVKIHGKEMVSTQTALYQLHQKQKAQFAFL